MRLEDRLKSLPVSLDDIKLAEDRIRTTLPVTSLKRVLGRQDDQWLKCEFENPTHSFKVRGALNAVSQLDPDQRLRGVLARSSGNFAQAIAYCGHLLGINITVVMPETAPVTKLNATIGWGATVEKFGKIPREGDLRAREIQAEQGQTLLSLFDDLRVIAGQGTIGLELVAQLENIGAVYCPVGGGGLLSGIAVALKSLKPEIQIVAVEPENANDFFQSWTQQQLVEIPFPHSIADGLKVSRVGANNWAVLQHLVDRVITVSDDDIRWAVADLWTTQSVRVEPSGAAAYAAMCNDGERDGSQICILSGGNVDQSVFEDCLLAYPALNAERTPT
jgi:threonine dehydratase